MRLGRWVSALDAAEALLCCAGDWLLAPAAQFSQVLNTLLRQVEASIGQLRSPGLRHALIRSVQEINLWRYRRSQSGPEAELALVEQLERLRQLSLQPPSQRQGDALDALEDAVASAWLGGALSNTDDRHLAWIANAEQLPEPEFESQPSRLVALSPGDVLVYPVLGRQLGVLLWRTGNAEWQSRPLSNPAQLRRAISDLLELLAAGHAAVDDIDPLSAWLTDALHWRDITANATRVMILADAQSAAIPYALFESESAQRSIVLLQSLHAMAPLQIDQLRLIAAAQTVAEQAVLTQVDRELDEVAQAWPQLPQLRSDQVSLTNITQALAAPNTLLHVAAHGSGARRVEEDSGLWLSVGNRSGSSFLSSVRVQHLSLASEAVILSACESGYSRASGSMGMGGLAGAVSSAGAKVVVGSRWAVNDRASRVFSTALHQAWSAHADQPQLALLKAQQAVRAQRAFRHPSHWAGWFWLQRGPISQPVSQP
nr:CHAT domain-containing protein [Pseudomarimonas arenosa]